MTRQLARLNESEKELLFKAPLLVCILIAGADGTIDDKEIGEAVQMTRKSHWVKSSLSTFFHELANDFEDKLKIVIQTYPFEVDRRSGQISMELAQLNLLWQNLEPEFSVAYFEMLKHLARGVAGSSGRFWSRIGPEEAKLLDLPMIKEPPKN